MKTVRILGLCAQLCAGAVLTLAGAGTVRAADDLVIAKPVDKPVTLTENGASWTLDNGIVKATILKASSNMQSLV